MRTKTLLVTLAIAALCPHAALAAACKPNPKLDKVVNDAYEKSSHQKQSHAEECRFMAGILPIRESYTTNNYCLGGITSNTKESWKGWNQLHRQWLATKCR